MKKLILMVGCLALLASCGGGKTVYGDLAVKDKNGDVVGYTSISAILLNGLMADSAIVQDLNGNWVDLAIATGKLNRNNELYFSTVNCGGTAYVGEITTINRLFKTYPFMTDSAKTAADTSATSRFYELTSIASETDTVRSFFDSGSKDTSYTTENPYNLLDSNTWKYKCESVATFVSNLGTPIGSCTASSGQVTCRDTIDLIYSSGGVSCSACAGATFTPYPDQGALPLENETYEKYWGVLTEVSAADITDGKVIVDYSEVAPLTIEAYN